MTAAAGRKRAAAAWRPSDVAGRLEIRVDPVKGRAVFAAAPIAEGILIEAAPVVIVPKRERALIDETVLHDYYFQWSDGPEGAGPGAVALGLVSLCNHSPRPNARAQRNPARRTLDLIALSEIAAGEEITIDYACTLWFDPQE